MRRATITVTGMRRLLVILAMVAPLVALSAATPAGAASGTWSVTPTPNTAPNLTNTLLTVSCPVPNTCTAVGLHRDASGDDHPLIESATGGGWTIVPSPSPTSATNSFLVGISCVSTTSCTAVGDSWTTFGDNKTLIESWNGTEWSVVPSPNTTDAFNVLDSVSCSTATDCVAVGGAGSTSLVETLAGGTWTITPAPGPGFGAGYFGVSCTAPGSCTAVGTYDQGNVAQTLVATSLGGTWSLVPSPNSTASPGEYSILEAVACPSATTCTAVGIHYGSATITQTLVEREVGGAWVLVASPNTAPNQNNWLNGISCPTSASCTAIGFAYPNAHISPLVETLANGTWTLTSPTPSLVGSLSGVSCIAPEACTAAGATDPNGTQQTLVESISPPLPTSLAATPAALGLSPFGLNLWHLHATLRSSGTPVAGQPIVFAAGSTTLCTATTGSGGVASCNALTTPGLLSTLLAGGYTATYGGNTAYLPSRASAGLVD
jgi:hypothetical protein